MDPLISLAFVAGVTSRIRLGTSVLIMPYYTPVMLGTAGRQEAVLASNAELGWRTKVSEANEPLDELLAANVFLQTSVLSDVLGIT